MFNLEDYEPVDSRIAKWWDKHPNGSIQTEIVKDTGSAYIMKATLYTEEGLIVTTGYASEVITERGVNATSALENCETSAIGRALANAGYQAKIGKRASREEMEKVQRSTTAPADVWAASAPSEPTLLGSAIDVLARELGTKVIEVPSCKHGLMAFKDGVSTKTGKPYSGYICTTKDRKDQCEARWNK